jgi:hypothetical protein
VTIPLGYAYDKRTRQDATVMPQSGDLWSPDFPIRQTTFHSRTQKNLLPRPPISRPRTVKQREDGELQKYTLPKRRVVFKLVTKGELKYGTE